MLEPTAADKVRAEKEHKDSEARAAAAFAAEEAARKDEAQKATEKRRLDDEKKASDTKRRAETREQRLTTARKVRHLARKVGSYRLLVALEPGASAATTVLEVRVSLTKKLEVADARFGLLEPEPGASLIANVREANGKDVLGRSYVMHPMETPGSYGFHTTPLRAGLVNVTVRGTAADGTAIDATLPVHVGTWPPPDFDDEEKNNAALREEGKQASTAGGEN